MNLTCGLEIHQRLATKTKLFCNCPAKAIEQEQPCGEVKRVLRAVYGELGQVDPAAEFEGNRKRSFTYQIFRHSSCLVELDEAPPREINDEALQAAVEISLLLGARVLDEVYTMRKTVVDGSATSAFQRTALVAVDGKLETSFGTVKIPTICLEEESCGIVERKGNEVVYRLDRLGIPLIEIATDPSIRNGSQVREAAQKIGLLLRSAGRAQRGIGSIRQDLNVSVQGGARVEIKGAQELALIGELVENEAKRQYKLLEVKEALGKRPVEKSGEVPEAVDLTQELSSTKCTFVQKAIARGDSALAVRLKGFGGLLGFELLEGHRLGTELSDYAKASAGVSGIIHSDEEMQKYGFSPEEVTQISTKLSCGELDGWVMCVAQKQLAQTALQAVVKRADAARIGVPKETRRAEGEKSRFMRPLPGSARMYPETDVPQVPITKQFLEKISSNLPESFEEKTRRFKGMGLGEQLAEGMAKSELSGRFEELADKTRAEPTLIAVTLLQTLTSLSRQGTNISAISETELEKVLSATARAEIVKSAVPVALEEIAAGSSFEQAVAKKGLARISASQLEQICAAEAKKEPDHKRLLGNLMGKYRLQADPAELAQVIASLGKHFKDSGVNK